MKRVAFLTHGVSLLSTGAQGGSSISLLEDSQILEEAGYDVEIWGPAGKHGVPVRQIPLHFGSGRLSSLEYCARFVGANPSSVLVAYDTPTVALLAPSRTIIRFSWEARLPRYWRRFWALDRFRRATYLFPSHAACATWCGRHPEIPMARTNVIWNSVDLQLFSAAVSQTERCRVGFASQWVVDKGLGVLMAAWEEVHRHLPQAELWLAGGTDLWQRRARIPAEQLIHARDLEGLKSKGVRVIGVVPREQMPQFWAQVDVACVPPIWNEQFGRVALEAMACSRAVVVSDSGALPEVVGDAGVVVPKGDGKCLAEALLELLRSPGRRIAMAERSRQRAADFSPQLRGPALVSLVERVGHAAAIHW